MLKAKAKHDQELKDKAGEEAKNADLAIEDNTP
jgi:hypothetical protein